MALFLRLLFLIPKLHLFLGSDDVQVNKVDSLILSSSTLEEIPLDLVNKISGFLG